MGRGCRQGGRGLRGVGWRRLDGENMFRLRIPAGKRVGPRGLGTYLEQLIRGLWRRSAVRIGFGDALSLPVGKRADAGEALRWVYE